MQCVIPTAAVAEVLLPLSAFSACVVGVISSIARRPDLLGLHKSCKRGSTVQDTEKIHNVVLLSRIPMLVLNTVSSWEVA